MTTLDDSTSQDNFVEDCSNEISEIQQSSSNEPSKNVTVPETEKEIQIISDESQQHFPCHLCNLKTSCGTDLHRHIVDSHSNVLQEEPPTTPKQSKPAKHLELRPVIRGFKCGVVGCDFRTTHLNPFMCVHINDPPARCKQLRRSQFPTASSMPSAGIVRFRVYYCLHCNYKSASSEKLNKHTRKHSAQPDERKVQKRQSLVKYRTQKPKCDVNPVPSENVATGSSQPSEVTSIDETDAEKKSQTEKDVDSEVADFSPLSSLCADSEKSHEKPKSSEECCARVVQELELLANSTPINDVVETEQQSIQEHQNDLSQSPKKACQRRNRKSARISKPIECSLTSKSNANGDSSNADFETEKVFRDLGNLKPRPKCKRRAKGSKPVSEVHNQGKSAAEEELVFDKPQTSELSFSTSASVEDVANDIGLDAVQVPDGENLDDSETDEEPVLTEDLSASKAETRSVDRDETNDVPIKHCSKILEIREKQICSSSEEVVVANKKTLNVVSLQTASNDEKICREVIDEAFTILETTTTVRPEAETQNSFSSSHKPIKTPKRATGNGSWLEMILQATEAAEPSHDQNEAAKHGEEEEPLIEGDLHLSDQFIESILCNDPEHPTSEDDHSKEDQVVEDDERQIASNLESGETPLQIDDSREEEAVNVSQSRKVLGENSEDEDRHDSVNQRNSSPNESNCCTSDLDASFEENLQRGKSFEADCSDDDDNGSPGVLSILNSTDDENQQHEKSFESDCSGVATNLNSADKENKDLTGDGSFEFNCSKVLEMLNSSTESDYSGVISIADSSFEDPLENVGHDEIQDVEQEPEPPLHPDESSDRSIVVDPKIFSGQEEDSDLEMTVSFEPDPNQFSFNLQSREQNEETFGGDVEGEEDLSYVDRTGNEKQQEPEVEGEEQQNENRQCQDGENEEEEAAELDFQPSEVTEEIFPDVPAERKSGRKRKLKKILAENFTPKRMKTSRRNSNQNMERKQSSDKAEGGSGDVQKHADQEKIDDGTAKPAKKCGRPKRIRPGNENDQVSSAKRRLTNSTDVTTDTKLSLSTKKSQKSSKLSNILTSNESLPNRRSFKDFSTSLRSASIKLLRPIIRGKKCPHCPNFKTTIELEIVEHIKSVHPDEAVASDYVGVDPADIERYEKVRVRFERNVDFSSFYHYVRFERNVLLLIVLFIIVFELPVDGFC